MGGCRGVYRDKEDLSLIAGANYEPGEIFAAGGKIYMQYSYGGVNFWLAAKLPKDGKENKKKNQTLEAEVLKKIPVFKKSAKEEIYLVKDVLDRALSEEAAAIAPRENGTGFVIGTFFKDMVFYRGKDGTLNFVEPGAVPAGIKILNRTSKKTLRAGTVQRVAKLLAKEYPGETKFIFPLQKVPRVPYLYFDAKKNFISAIKLPDFYDVKKDISPITFGADLAYSFFIKSHVFAVAKAPFTSAHRLVSDMYSFTAIFFRPGVNNLAYGAPPLNTSGEMMDLDDFNKYLDKKIRKNVYKGSVKILIDGDDFFQRFIETAQNAQKYIDMRLYIYKTDPYTLSISDLLKKKSNEGVSVRMILDDINTVLNWAKTPESPAGQDYIMPGVKKYLRHNSKIKVRTHPNTWATADHAKVIIVDGKTAYTGGMNFGEEYRYLWHDMMLELRGPIVHKLQNNFEEAWAFAGAAGDFNAAAVMANEDCDECFKSDYDGGMIDIRPLYTKPSRPDIFKAQLEAIRRAKSRIYIQNAYFSDNRIVRALIDARQRGVDVRVILPSQNDIGVMDSNNKVKTNVMLANGIRVYFYPKMSHIKAALYDGWACVGSANFDRMSLFVNGEMSLGISDKNFAEELNEKLFKRDFADSEEITKPLKVDAADYLLTMLSAHV